MAFDAATGKLAWKTATGGAVRAAPMTYAVDNRQYVVVAAGGSLFAFGLPEPPGGGNEKAVGQSSGR
jgi:glucose dehydrogenase